MPCQDSNRRRQTYSASQCCACSFWGQSHSRNSQKSRLFVVSNVYQMAICCDIKMLQCSGVSPFLENISYCTCMVGSGLMYRNGEYRNISYCTYMVDSSKIYWHIITYVCIFVCVNICVYIYRQTWLFWSILHKVSSIQVRPFKHPQESPRISFKLSSGQQNETKSSVEFIVIIQNRPMAMHASQVQRSGVIFTEFATGESLE